MKNKSVGFWLSAITCVLAVITLIMLLVYGSKGGQVQGLVYAAAAAAILLEAASLFGEKPWTDFTGILGAAFGNDSGDAGHDNIINKRGDNFTKGTTDDDTDGHIDDVAFKGKRFEYFDEGKCFLFYNVCHNVPPLG